MAGRAEHMPRLREEYALAAIRQWFIERPEQLDATSPHLQEFARRVLASSREPEPKELTLVALRSRFHNLRSRVLEANPDDPWWQQQRRLDQSDVEGLVGARILLQGASVPCRACGTNRWYPVDDLRTQMRCNGCLSTFPLPVAPDWSFRLNELVQSGLKWHGLLPTVHLLYVLLQRNSDGYPTRSFVTIPSQNLFEGDSDSPYTELDILALQDGEFLIGEVKSRPEAFRPEGFAKLLEVAKALLPGRLVIAAEGEAWPPEVEGQIDALKQSLADRDVIVTKMLLRWRR